MRRFALDTSCMVATICSWHERHEATVSAVDRRLRRGERLVIAAHALVETYAVLTRLPAPHRLAPADAWTLIHANFVDAADVATIDAAGHVSLLDRLAADGLGGGRTYDALIAAAVGGTKAATLLTLNPRHFHPAPRGIVVEEP